MAELRINTTGKLSLFDADDSHAASIVAGTVTANENVMSLATAGVTFNVPTITLGDATAEDTKLVFDGNAQDFYIGLDDSADDLVIGLGSTVGTTPIISLDENMDIAIGPTSDVTITNDGNTDTLTLKSTDADGNSGPNLKLARDSGSPADGDVIGQIMFTADDDGGNATDFFTMSGNIRDASNGNEEVQMVFYGQRNGAVVNYLEFDDDHVVFNEGSADIDFRVESDSSTTMFNLQAVNANNSAGSIGLNTSNADGNFFEASNPQSGVYSGKFIASAASSSIYGLQLLFSNQNPDDNSSQYIVCSDGAAVRMRVYADGDIQNHDNSYGSTSDSRIKQQIADASSQWDDMKAVKVRKFKFNSDVTEKGDSDALWRLGVVAQELEASGMNGLVKPEVQYQEGDQETKDHLYTQKDKDAGAIPDGKDVGDVQIAKKGNVGDIKDYKSVKYSILYMKAIKALQEAQTRIETLETKVAALEG